MLSTREWGKKISTSLKKFCSSATMAFQKGLLRRYFYPASPFAEKNNLRRSQCWVSNFESRGIFLVPFASFSFAFPLSFLSCVTSSFSFFPFFVFRSPTVAFLSLRFLVSMLATVLLYFRTTSARHDLKCFPKMEQNFTDQK